jgi:hypothetical protein
MTLLLVTSLLFLLVSSSLLTAAACGRFAGALGVANVLAFAVDLTSACNPAIYGVFAFVGFSAFGDIPALLLPLLSLASLAATLVASYFAGALLLQLTTCYCLHISVCKTSFRADNSVGIEAAV